MSGARMKVKDIIRDTEWLPGDQYGGDRPLVSVFLPTYRRGTSGRFMRSARSVLAQSLGELELIVIDDASEDGTADQIRQLMAEDGRVSCLRHPQNVGLPAISEYEAFLKARAPYLAFAFDDDEFYPQALARLLEESLARGSGLVHGHVDVLGEDPHTGATVRWERFGGYGHPQSSLWGTNYLANLSVLLRRDVVERVGFYDPHIAVARVCDWDLWRRTAAHYEIRFVDVSVGVVQGGVTHDSLGKTYTLEPWMTHEWANRFRDGELRPGAIEEYNVLSIPPDLSSEIGGAIQELAKSFRQKFWFSAPVSSPAASGVEKAPPARLDERGAIGWIGNNGGGDLEGRILVVGASHDASTTLCFDHLPDPIRQRIRFCYVQNDLPEEMVGASAVIFVRLLSMFQPWIEFARETGVPHYYFLDDNLPVLAKEPMYAREFAFYSTANLRQLLKSFSGVLLSSERLAEYFREQELHPHLYYFPPIARPVQWWDAPRAMPEHGALRIGYFGGRHRAGAFREVVFPAIASVAAARPVELYVTGLDEPLPQQSGLKTTHLPLDLAYGAALGRLARCEIELLLHPSSDTANNVYKTRNVLISAHLVNAVPILSRTAPYEGLDELGVAFLCGDTKDWAGTIARVAGAPSLASEVRRTLAAYCEQHFHGGQNEAVVRQILAAHPSPGLILRDQRYRAALLARRWPATLRPVLPGLVALKSVLRRVLPERAWQYCRQHLRR